MPERWRTGRTVGRTIYRMTGTEASTEDQLIGVMDTPELATRVVAAVNAANAATAQWYEDARRSADTPCWLCEGLRGLAIHYHWTAQRGGDKPLWTAHRPTSRSHPVRDCPECEAKRLRAELAAERARSARIIDGIKAERIAIARVRAALATFDCRGVNNLDVPTAAEVLDAWRAALDASTAPESTESEEAEETDAVSDGYHTFGELYDHRRALTAALAKALNLDSWRSKAHHPDDSPMFEGGYFIVGINLPTGTITYHYKLSHWDDFAGVIELAHAPKWDGAPPAASVDRLLAWASTPDSHPFEQNPEATQASVCRCGKWPDHHIHTGNRQTCGCDDCRAARGDQ